jgi:hypothetical protein
MCLSGGDCAVEGPIRVDACSVFDNNDQLFETAQIAGRSTIIQNDSAAQHLITY